MKSFFLIAVLFLSTIISSQLVLSASCSQSGYPFCWEKSYTHNGITANSKIFFKLTDDLGRDLTSLNSPYAVGHLIIDVGSQYTKTGKTYIYTNYINDWSQLDSICSQEGCFPGTEVEKYAPQGKVSLANKGEFYNKCLVVVGYACNGDCSAFQNDYAWTTSAYGWLTSSVCPEFKVVECSENSHCSNGVCDTSSGNSANWKCVSGSTCVNGEEKCDGFTTSICSNNAWISQGIIKGKCNVQCNTASECATILTVRNECRGNSVVKITPSPKCEGYTCSSIDTEEIIETCSQSCLDGKCTTSSTESSTNIIYFVLGGVGVFVVLFLLLKNLKKRK